MTITQQTLYPSDVDDPVIETESAPRPRCGQCGSLMVGNHDVILCPNGHGRAIQKSNVIGFKDVSARALWTDSLPLATKVGSCTTDQVNRVIYKLDGRNEPFSATPDRGRITSKTKPLPGEVFAKVEGSYVYAVALIPTKLNPRQLTKLGF